MVDCVIMDDFAEVVRALTDRGVPCHGFDGINLWVDVADERGAALSLLVDGIGAAPGSAFEVTPGTQHHLRLTVGQVSDGVEGLADAVAAAASATPVDRRHGH